MSRVEPFSNQHQFLAVFAGVSPQTRKTDLRVLRDAIYSASATLFAFPSLRGMLPGGTTSTFT